MGLYRDGRIYDRMFAGGPGGAAPGAADRYWAELAQRRGGPVLELACGTGSRALPLARAGLTVAGIDNSPGMLAEARRKADAEGLSIDWQAGDMREFDLDDEYALVFIATNTLCHLLTVRDFERCAACVRAHLAPGGRFAVDVFVPDPALLVPKPGQRQPFAEYEDPDGRGHVVITESYVYEADTQIKRVCLHAVDGNGRETTARLDLRMYFPQELDALLRYNGFAVEHKYGDYDRGPFIASSSRQLLVCTA